MRKRWMFPLQLYVYVRVRVRVRVRAGGRVRVRARTKNYGLKSLKCIGAQIWNDIPVNIRSDTSREQLIKSVKNRYAYSY